jgi:peptide/nickel transport system ATP-binding protein
VTVAQLDPQTVASTAPDLAGDTVLRVENLSASFVFRSRTARAIRDVTFSLRKGRTLALVGESGSGKSVTSLAILRLLAHPGRIVGGRILYRSASGEVIDLAQADARTMRRRIRGREISMIFQEPMTSLNPLLTIGDQIGEMVRLHEGGGPAEARRTALEIRPRVEIPGADRRLDDYPHQMSGGMRQRVMIAMALVCRPALLIADEPTTALDVTIQAQILDLLKRLQGEFGMSILFITHNMGVVAEIADEVAVMYAGEVLEQSGVREIFASPRHPYTTGLLASIPDPRRDVAADGTRQRLTPIPGSVPSIYALPPGCPFEPRCPLAEARCKEPVVLVPAGPRHLTRCWKMGEPT